MPFWPGEDLAKWNLDAPPPYIPEPPKGINSRAHVVLEAWPGATNSPCASCTRYLAGARGRWVVIGAPQTIADKMQEWFENGACDGFNVMPPVLPQSLNEFVGWWCPSAKTRPVPHRLRGHHPAENLGLERPTSRYAEPLAKAA